MRMGSKVLWFFRQINNSKTKTMDTTKEEMIMNNYCKRCRLRDGCLQKCKEAEIYEQGYHDAVDELKKLKKTKKMEDNVKKVMDFIARIAFCEIESDQYEKFLERIKNKIENELEKCNYSEFDDYDEDE